MHIKESDNTLDISKNNNNTNILTINKNEHIKEDSNNNKDAVNKENEISKKISNNLITNIVDCNEVTNINYDNENNDDDDEYDRFHKELNIKEPEKCEGLKEFLSKYEGMKFDKLEIIMNCPCCHPDKKENIGEITIRVKKDKKDPVVNDSHV